MYYVLYLTPEGEERWMTVYGEDAMQVLCDDLVAGGCEEIHVFNEEDEIE